MPDETDAPLDSGGHPPTSARARPRGSWAFALGLLGALIGIVGYVVVVDPSGSDDTATPGPAPTTSTTVATAEAADVYDTILPSLVYLHTDLPTGAGIGSGVIVNEEGHILTAHHVVRNATTIEVEFSDGTESTARIISEDPENDIAVLESADSPEVIVPAVLGGSNGLRIGDVAYPAGNPLGFRGSFTAGVISGLDRSIPRQDGSGVLSGLIQFDAAVNPGSSGGPLLNRDGQVVGIVTALANPLQQNFFIGIGFAIPIATAGGAAGGPPQ
jgi:S1-C subfamily serine protease